MPSNELPAAANVVDDFRRWVLLRFGHAEAAYRGLEAVARRCGTLQEGKQMDVATVEEAVRLSGFQRSHGLGQSLFGELEDAKAIVDPTAFVTAIARLGPRALSYVDSLTPSPLPDSSTPSPPPGSSTPPPIPGAPKLQTKAADAAGIEWLRAQCLAHVAQIRQSEENSRQAVAARLAFDAKTQAVRAASSVSAGGATSSRPSIPSSAQHTLASATSAATDLGLKLPVLRAELAAEKRHADTVCSEAALSKVEREELEGARALIKSLRVDLETARRDKSELSGWIATEQNAAGKVTKSAGDTLVLNESSLASQEVEARLTETQLERLEEEASKLTSEALDLVSGTSRPQVAPSPRESIICGFAGIRDAHRSLARQWSRRHVSERRVRDEISAARLAVEKMRNSCEQGAIFIGGESRLRLELQEAREASNVVWGMVAGVDRDTTENDELRRQHAGVREDQEQAIASFRTQSDEMRSTLNVAISNAQRAEAERNQKILNLREEVRRSRASFQSLQSEFELQQRMHRAKIDKSMLNERQLCEDFRIEKKRSLQDLQALRDQGQDVRVKYDEVVRVTREEHGALQDYCTLATTAEMKMQGEWSHQQASTQVRKHELRSGFAELEDAHVASQFQLQTERDKFRDDTSRRRAAFQRTSVEFANLSGAVGRRRPAQVLRYLAEEEEHLAQAFLQETQLENRAATFLSEIHTTRQLESEHDVRHREHTQLLGQKMSQAEQDLRQRLQEVHVELDQAEGVVCASKKEALQVNSDVARSVREEMSEVRKAEREVSAAEVQQLRAELDTYTKLENDTIRAASSEATSARQATQTAAAACNALVKGVDAKYPMPDQSAAGPKVAVDQDSKSQSTRAAEQVAEALQRVAFTETREAAVPLGRLYRKKMRLTSEAAAISKECVQRNMEELNLVKREQSVSENRMLTEMGGAATRVERLQQILSTELAMLQGKDDGVGAGERLYKERAALMSNVQRLRQRARDHEAQISIQQRVELHQIEKGEELRDRQHAIENSLHQETARLQHIREIHAEECSRSHQLTDTVTVHSEVLRPAHESELNAAFGEGRFAEARIRTEIAAERRACAQLRLGIEAVSEATAEAEARAGRSAEESSALASRTLDLEISMSQLDGRHAERMSDEQREGQIALDMSKDLETKQLKDIERRRYDLCHLEELGYGLEREVERRLAQRAALCRDELGGIEAVATTQRLEEAAVLDKVRERCVALEEQLDDLKEEKTRAGWELAKGRTDWQRWCCSGGGPEHVKEAEELKSELLKAKVVAAEEFTQERQQVQKQLAEAAATAAAAEGRAWRSREEETLSAASAALDAVKASCSAAAVHAIEAATRAKELSEAGYPGTADIGHEETISITMEYQIQSQRSAEEATERHIAMRMQSHRRRASMELQELREALARLRAEAQLQSEQSMEVNALGCPICGKSHWGLHPRAPRCDDDMCLADRFVMSPAYDSAPVDARLVADASQQGEAHAVAICPNEIADGELLHQLSTVHLGQARWKKAAQVARESLREATSPAHIAQLKADRAEIVDLRISLDELRHEETSTEAAGVAAHEVVDAKKALLIFEQENEANAVLAVSSLHLEASALLDNHERHIEGEIEAAEELALVQREIGLVEVSMEGQTLESEQALEALQIQVEEAVKQAENHESHITRYLDNLQADLLSWCADATATLQAFPEDVPSVSTTALLPRCHRLCALWQAALKGVKADSEATIGALEEEEVTSHRQTCQFEAENTAIREELEVWFGGRSHQQQELQASQDAELSQLKQQMREAEDQLRQEIGIIETNEHELQGQKMQQSYAWSEELRGLSEHASIQHASKLDEWRAEREVLSGVCSSWRQGTGAAREYLQDLEEREYKLQQNTSVAVKRMNDTGATIRREMQERKSTAEHRMEAKVQNMSKQLDQARFALSQHEHASAAEVNEEIQAHSAHELRREQLSAELGAMKAAIADLRKKHHAAVRTVGEMDTLLARRSAAVDINFVVQPQSSIASISSDLYNGESSVGVASIGEDHRDSKRQPG